MRQALALGGGSLIRLSGDEKSEKLYSEQLYCPDCHRGLAPLDPRLFSFNSRHGACPACDGIGSLEQPAPAERSLCPKCHGERLNPQARAVFWRGWSIGQLVHLHIDAFERELKSFRFAEQEQPIGQPIVNEIRARINFLRQVGLGYLELDRAGDTLSGGETQRIRLAAQLGSNLRGICYILDEPTIGLHPVDNERLLKMLHALKQRGNTIVTVEHDVDTMRRSDTLIELGPGAGQQGGRLVAQGAYRDLCRNPQTLTGKWCGKTLYRPPADEGEPFAPRMTKGEALTPPFSKGGQGGFSELARASQGAPSNEQYRLIQQKEKSPRANQRALPSTPG